SLCPAPRELKEVFWPDLLGARRFARAAPRGPAGGSDPRAIATRATPAGGDYLLNGHKMWISNITIADVVNVTAMVDGNDRYTGGVGRFLVERDKSPFEARTINTLGLRQGHPGQGIFDNCRVPNP